MTDASLLAALIDRAAAEPEPTRGVALLAAETLREYLAEYGEIPADVEWRYRELMREAG